MSRSPRLYCHGWDYKLDYYCPVTGNPRQMSMSKEVLRQQACTDIINSKFNGYNFLSFKIWFPYILLLIAFGIFLVKSMGSTSHKISMAQCKTAVTPLLTHWSYYSLALSPRYVVHAISLQQNKAKCEGCIGFRCLIARIITTFDCFSDTPGRHLWSEV